MKIISFLGFNSYTETTYLSPCSQKSYKTPFFQEALVEFYQPDILYVMLTKKAETELPKGATESNWSALKKRLADKVQLLEPISNIPEKNSPEDIWTIFQKVTNVLQDGDVVIFDITHGFRSVPIVALIAVSYLRVVRQVKIEGLLYGAFEAKNEEKNETPTFDLLPIVSLLDWTTATDQFIKTGNGESLAALLHNSHTETENLAGNIQGIAQGLHLLRPMDVMKESALLPERIKEATPIISKSVPPFSTLLERIEKDYGDFGLGCPEDYENNAKASLVRQLRIIQWYAAKGEIVHCLSLAREWLPSLLCYHFELDPIKKSNREEMELLLTGGIIKNEQDEIIKQSLYLTQWLSLTKEKRKQINKLWGGTFNLANLRNDALHAGFRKNPKSATVIIQECKKIIDELKAIAITWNLLDD